MQDVRAGELGKLEILFDRHHPGLFRYFLSLTANRSVSEDLAQEVFFRILKYRHTYQPGSGFRPWLYSVGRNVWADHMGKRKPEVARLFRQRDLRVPITWVNGNPRARGRKRRASFGARRRRPIAPCKRNRKRRSCAARWRPCRSKNVKY